MIRTGVLLIVAAVALFLAGCGSSGGSASSAPAAPPATAQSTATTSEPANSAATKTAQGASFCKGLQPHGEGPADAFLVVATYSPSAAGKGAKGQLALMAGVSTPPQEIAADWSAWRSYLTLVVKDSAKPGAAASLATTLNGPTKAIEPARKKLENFAFAHCK